ncbi:MAG: MarR family transcriptional regulator [Clostridiales bacterium]|nr:MarR family transcriptional regulator [Clostridiales bacterium]
MTTEQKVELVRLFGDISKMLKHVFDKVFCNTGITMPQGMVIDMLARNGEMMISDLSNKLGLSNSTVSGIVDRLEKIGFVERVRSLEDKRAVYVKLTQKHKENFHVVNGLVMDKFSRLLENTSDDELDKIMEGLTVLKSVMERNSAKAVEETSIEPRT